MDMNFDEYMEMNNQAMGQLMVVSNNMNEMIKRVKDESVKSAVEASSIIVGELKTAVAILSKDNELFKSELKDAKDTIEQIKEVTYVLATDDGKMKELTRLIQMFTYKCTGNKSSIKDQLFHKIITNACYKHIYSQYQINSYKRIKIDDFDESIKVIKRWFGNKENIKKVINKRLKEYINDKHLPQYKQDMVDKYLELIGGNIDNAI
jgi:hypothetical protein